MDDFLDFMESYVSFVEEMAGDSSNWVAAMSNYNLQEAKQSVKNQQAMVMKLESMEKQRMDKQKKAGFGELSMTEIINKLEPPLNDAMQGLYERLSNATNDIKLNNGIAMEAAEDNLRLFAVPRDAGATKTYSSSGAVEPKSVSDEKSGRNLKIKI